MTITLLTLHVQCILKKEKKCKFICEICTAFILQLYHPFLFRILAMSHKETLVTSQDFGFVQFAWVSKSNDSIKWIQIEILNQPMPTQFGKLHTSKLY